MLRNLRRHLLRNSQKKIESLLFLSCWSSCSHTSPRTTWMWLLPQFHHQLVVVLKEVEVDLDRKSQVLLIRGMGEGRARSHQWAEGLRIGQWNRRPLRKKRASIAYSTISMCRHAKRENREQIYHRSNNAEACLGINVEGSKQKRMWELLNAYRQVDNFSL